MKTQLDLLKESGKAPEWMTEEGYITLTKGYLSKNETPREMYERVAKTAAKGLMDITSGSIDNVSDMFFQTMWNNWLCPASPILSNAGTNKGLTISCFGNDVQDSIADIMNCAAELAALTKNGGGVGMSVHRIRPRGSLIKGGANGQTEGIIPFIKIYDSTVIGISQGSTRRGAASINLPIEHGDWDEFVRMRRPEGDINRQCGNLHHCATVTDDFMQKVISGDKESRHRWAELMKTRMETGEPYIMFTDTVNKNNPDAYKKNDLEVSMTNICCLTGDTLVATLDGPKPIQELVGKKITIFDGKNWVECDSFEKKGTVNELYEIELKDGEVVRCTENHRWFVGQLEAIEVLTKHLKVGCILESTKFASKQDRDSFQIKSIRKIQVDSEPVYCPTIPTTSKFALANGLMTGNSEISLYTDKDNTFVCCLSSLNLAKYDEWKDHTVNGYSIPFIATLFLNGIMQDFINSSESVYGLEKARNHALNGRPIGLGVLGWHTLLQSKMIPFDNFQAMSLNAEIFRTIKAEAVKASQHVHNYSLIDIPKWCEGTGMFNTHLLAVAPTRSNSIISGDVSAGIEPIIANAYVDKTAKGTFIRRNELLEQVLEKYNKNNELVWKEISNNYGSVQHLDFLTDQEKEVFLTAYEIDQKALIRQASQRQKWVCQSQSLNLFFPVEVDPAFFNDVHVYAWEMGVKTLYYCRSRAGIKVSVTTDSAEDCKSCES